MSDNDLIRRGTAKQNIRDTLLEDDESYGGALWAIDDCPAVPHEMTAREFLHRFTRMCETYPAYGNNPGCKGCPLEYDRTCDLMRSDLADHFIEVVERWAREHPERSEE